MKLVCGAMLACLIVFGGEAAAKKPKFLFGGITVFFNQNSTSEEINEFCAKFGFFDAPPNYRYDPTTLIEQTDAPIYIWRRSDSPPLAQWIDLIVPFGEENRWIDILRAQTNIVSAVERIEVKEAKGGEEDLKFPEVSEKASAGVFTLTISGSSASAFERFDTFLHNRFRKPAVAFDDERYKVDQTKQRIFRVNHARHAVLQSGWQNLVLSVVVKEESKGGCQINVSIIGKAAPGYLELRTPDFSEYDDDLVRNHSDALQQFAAEIKDDLLSFLKKNS